MDYDVIVIGSGAGGLAAAVPLAQAGLKVLVCEQHEVPGGWTHSFTLEGYRFSPGVHYIGGIQPGGSLRRVYQGLGVSQDLAFCELNPDGYDHIFIGEERFDFPKGKKALVERLKQRFPHQATGIDGYFDAVSNMMDGLRQMGEVRGPLDAIQAAGKSGGVLRWLRSTGMDLISHYISDPVLQGVLSGQSGDHGLPPSQVSAFIHAGITHHYFDGGYYPLGGGFAIPRAFVRALKRAGGQIRLQTPVEKILLDGKRAVGVRLADGSELHARIIISNADPEVTFGRLVGKGHCSSKLQRKLNRVEYSVSALSLFFAVDMDLRAAGLDSGNFWFYDHADVDGLYQMGLTDQALKADHPPMMFLTVTTLKDPSKMHGGQHTCETFTFVNGDAFQQWAHEPSGAHSAGYLAMKEDMAWRMFQGLEKRIPGISQHITFWSLGTPLTNQHYIQATHGNLYGIAKSRTQIGPGAFPIQTEFEGLLMCGSSTTSHGVAGVTASGLSAAKHILGCSMDEILSQNGPELAIYPSEDVTQWPEYLQKRIARGKLAA